VPTTPRPLQIRALHPKYTVTLDLNDNGLPAVLDVKYSDGAKVQIAAQGKPLSDLFDELIAPTEAIQEKEESVEMEKN